VLGIGRRRRGCELRLSAATLRSELDTPIVAQPRDFRARAPGTEAAPAPIAPGASLGHCSEAMVAARRKKPVAPAAADAGAFAVVVETLRGDFKVFGEALSGFKAEVRDEFASVRAEVHNVRAETQAGFERLDREVRTGFERVDRELAGVKGDLADVKQDLVGVKQDLVGVKQDLAGVKQDLVGVKQDLVGVKQDLVGVKHELGLVKSAVLEHSRELREIRDRKVERDEVEGIVQGVLARTGGG
jgi:hypothetical protein